MADYGPLGGVKIAGFISPGDTTDSYAVIDTKLGIDGLRNYSGNTIEVLSGNTITQLRRRAGMIVGIEGGDQYFKLKDKDPWDFDLTDWEEIFFSSGDGAPITGGTAFPATQTLTFYNSSGGTFNVLDAKYLFSDLSVTGGTYNGVTGCVTFGTNSGTTFPVCGFLTISADTFVTGATLNGDSLEIGRNQSKPLISVDLSSLSGESQNLQNVLDEGTTGPTFPFTTSDSVGILPTNSIVMGTGNPFGSPPVSATTLVWLDAEDGTINIAAHNLSGITTNDGATKISGENSFGESNIDVSGGEIDINTTGSTIVLEADGNILIDGLGELTSPIIGDVLSAKDTSGRLKWVTLSADTNTFVTGGTFPTAIPDTLSLHYNTGGSAADIDLSSLRFSGGVGDCIVDLYLTNLHGCSPITIHDPTQHISSTASGINSIAWGSGTTASGGGSHAEGLNTVASGDLSHAEGNTTIASGGNSHAEGGGVIAAGINSHAGGEGFDITNRIIASGKTSFVHFEQTTASGYIGAYGDNSAILGGADHNIETGSTYSIIIGGDGGSIGSGSTSSGIFGGVNNTIEWDIVNSTIIGGGENLIEIVTSGACGCPCDYVYDEVSELCTTYSATSATTGVAISKGPVHVNYGGRGARFCIPNSYPGTPLTCIDSSAVESAIHYRVQDSDFWGTGSTANGRLNAIGVNNPTMIASADTWFGFSRCINAPSDGQYLFGMGGDDYVKATLNGEIIVALDNSPTVAAELAAVPGMSTQDFFKQWWVWPVDLLAGQNTLLIEGADGLGSQASFGCEIVGPFTPNTFSASSDFHIFSAQTGIDIWTGNTIFSSLSTVGGTFDSELYPCPDGYSYDSCSGECIKAIECSPIITSASIIGGCSNTITNSAQFGSILGGSQNIIDGAIGTTILGGQNITGSSVNTAYVPNLNINYQPDNDDTLSQLLVRDTDGTVKYRDASSISGGSGTFTGNTSGDCVEELWVANISGCTGQDLHIGVQPGQDIYFDSTGTTANPNLYINSKGQIGVGTNDPFNWAPNDGTGIEIYNESSVDNQIPFAVTEAGSRKFYIETDFGTTSDPVHWKGSGSGTNLMTFYTVSTRARVGVGTTIPDGTFQIAKAGSIANQTKYPDETNIVINNTSNGYSGDTDPYSSAFRFDHGTGEDPGGLITSKRLPTWDSGEKSTTLEIWNASGETNFRRVEIRPEWNTNIFGDITVKYGGVFFTQLNASFGPWARVSGTTTDLIQLGVTQDSAQGLTIGTRGETEPTYAGYGKQGDGFLYSSAEQNGLNIISANGTGTEDYIKFYGGTQANATASVTIVGSGSTKGFVGIGIETPTEKLHVQDGNIVELYDHDGTSFIAVKNFDTGVDARASLHAVVRGEGGIDSSGVFCMFGAGYTGSTGFSGQYLPNSLTLATGGGADAQRAHVNIGSRRTDGQIRFFTGDEDYDNNTLLGIWDTTGLTLSGDAHTFHFNTDTIQVRNGATTGYVLTSDANGVGSWQPLTFTGNTSGDCINELWVSTISGCSPVTIGSSIKSISSTVDGISSIAYGDNNSVEGDNSTIMGGVNNQINEPSTYSSDNYTLSFSASSTNTIDISYTSTAPISAIQVEFINDYGTPILPNITGATDQTGGVLPTIAFSTLTVLSYKFGSGQLPAGSGTLLSVEFDGPISSFFPPGGDAKVLEESRIVGDNTVYFTGGTGNGADMLGDGYPYTISDVVAMVNGLIGSTTLGGVSAEAWNFCIPATSAGNMSGNDGIENLSGVIQNILGFAPATTDTFCAFENIYGGTGNSTILGGEDNSINTVNASIIGGKDNIVDGPESSIIGSTRSYLSGNGSVILGGDSISGTNHNTVYVPTLNISTLCPTSGGTYTNLLVDDKGYVVTGDGGTSSGDCISDLWVSNIHSCSPLNINPGDEGNIYMGSTSGFTYDVGNERLGIGTVTPDYKLEVEGGNINQRWDQNGMTQMRVANLDNGTDSRSSLALVVKGEDNITSSGVIAQFGTGYTGFVGGSFEGHYLANSLTIATGGGADAQRAHLNIGTRRTDGEIRFFTGDNDYDDNSLLGIWDTTGLTLSGAAHTFHFNTDTIQVRNGAVGGHVLTATDSDGNASWQSPLVTDELNELIDANTNSTSVVLANHGAGVQATAGTGVSNFVALSGALSGTSGNDNIVIGRNAAPNKTTAANNIIMGQSAVGTPTTGSPTKSIIMGYRSGYNFGSTTENVVIGYSAAASTTSNDRCTILGAYAGEYQYGDNQTIIGYRAGQDDTGYLGWTNSCTLVGAYAGYNIVGVGNISIGEKAGYNQSVVTQYTGTNNILLGNGVLLNASGTTSQLVVGGLDRYLLSGEFNTTDRAKLGVNISNDIPTANLQVKGHASDTTTVLIQDGSDNTLVSVDNIGNLHVTGRTTTENFTMTSGATNGYVLTSDASGNASWQVGGGGTPFSWSDPVVKSGNTSVDCITDLWVSNIHSCSPLNINPGDEGNVYYGSTSGVTIDVINSRLGIGTSHPQKTLHVGGDALIANPSGDATLTLSGGSYDDAVINFDNVGVSTPFAQIKGDTHGVGNSGSLEFWTYPSGGPLTRRVVIGTHGRVAIGDIDNTDIDTKLLVDGSISGTSKIYTDTLQVHDGAISGYVLTSDASGNASWQPPSGGTGTSYWEEGSGLKDTLGGHTISSGASTDFSIIAGGENNQILGVSTTTKWNAIVGGADHQIWGGFPCNYNAILGGNTNQIGGLGDQHNGCTIIGGGDNTIEGECNNTTIIGMSGVTIVGAGGNLDDTVFMQRVNIGAAGIPTTEFRLDDGTQQNGYVLTSDASGNASWQPGGGGTPFSWSDPVVKSGNTSVDCIDVLWVSIISGCSPVTIGSSIQSDISIASGLNSMAYGNNTIASGEHSQAFGSGTTASTQSAHAEGNVTKASGVASHAEGAGTKASGVASHAEGGWDGEGGAVGTTASGLSSHAEGAGTTAEGDYSHAEGKGSTASGAQSHAEGGSTASGSAAHAEGDGTTASGDRSHAQGHNTEAMGLQAHSAGARTIASGTGSFASGDGGGAGFEIVASGYTSFVHYRKSLGAGVPIGAWSDYSTILGGTDHNIVEGNENSIILGGDSNEIVGPDSENTFIIGGDSNTLNITSGTMNSGIIGGLENIIGELPPAAAARSYQSVIVGGQDNDMNGIISDCFMGGGSGNTITSFTSVNRSVILGGYNITATNDDTVYVPNLDLCEFGGTLYTDTISGCSPTTIHDVEFAGNISYTNVVETTGNSSPIITGKSRWKININNRNTSTLPNGVDGQKLSVYIGSETGSVLGRQMIITLTPVGLAPQSIKLNGYTGNFAMGSVELLYDDTVGWIVMGGNNYQVIG